MNIIKKYKNSRLRKKDYISYLRSKGITIGDNCIISHEYSIIDFFAPFLITIGNNVCISSGNTILIHDYSRCVVSRLKGNVLGYGGPISIGNNVFIGMHVTILPNTIIEDNVIIGSNSVVKGTLPSGYVYCGNPARKICTIAEYEQKREKKQIIEAKNFAYKYIAKYGKKPTENVFKAFDYQWLWSDITETNRFKKDFATKNNSLALTFMKNKKRPYITFDDFLNDL